MEDEYGFPVPEEKPTKDVTEFIKGLHLKTGDTLKFETDMVISGDSIPTTAPRIGGSGGMIYTTTTTGYGTYPSVTPAVAGYPNTRTQPLPTYQVHYCPECGADVASENWYTHQGFHARMSALAQKLDSIESLLSKLSDTEGLRLADLIGHLDAEEIRQLDS